MIEDPISGLVEYAQDVKPYHTKIIAVLVDYIHEETAKVTIDDSIFTDIGMLWDFHTNYCSEGWGMPPWGDPYVRKLDLTLDIDAFPYDSNGDGIDDVLVQLGSIITNFGPVNRVATIARPDIMYIPGDFTTYFPLGSVFSIINTFNNDGSWMVKSVNTIMVTNPTTMVPEIYTVIQISFVSSRLLLKMFSVFSSQWFPEGFTWINSFNPVYNNQMMIYTGGMWKSFYTVFNPTLNPLGPQFYITSTPILTAPTGSYWYNILTKSLSRFISGVWQPIHSSLYFWSSRNESLPSDLRAQRNIMYISGQMMNYLGSGLTIDVKNSTRFDNLGNYLHSHNGKWMITKLCDDLHFAELTVQHITDLTADGKIYPVVSMDPYPTWPSGMYWFNTTTSVLSMWDGGAWVPPLAPYTISTTLTPSFPVFPGYHELVYSVPSGQLFEFTSTMWVEVDPGYVVAGATPVPDSEGPRMNLDGYVVSDLSQFFEISNVESLSPSLIGNSEYSAFGTRSGCSISSNIPDQTLPSAIFSVSGEQTSNFTVGQTFIIRFSTGNDGVWRISNISYNIITNTTDLSAIFVSLATVQDQTTGHPNELFQTWDSIFGLGLGGIDLDLPLTSGEIEIYTTSNYDLPEICPYTSPTTASTKIEETFKTEISLPLMSYLNIVQVYDGGNLLLDPLDTGKFIVEGINHLGKEDFTRSFLPGSVFEILNSARNNGTWTVQSSYYDEDLMKTVIIPVEPIPRTGSFTVPPFGTIEINISTFGDLIGVSIAENNTPGFWEFYYHSAPTSTIETINETARTIVVSGDVRRFFRMGSVLTIQQSKQSIPNYPFIKIVNEGAWAYTVSGVSFDGTSTTIQVIESLESADVQAGFISSPPTWVRGVGWDSVGWAQEGDLQIGVANRQLLTSGSNVDFTFITNYNLFIIDQGSFDQLYYDNGGFGDILQQILPL